MIPAIRKTLFANSGKNESAPYIFVILCVYFIINSVYTGLFFGVDAMLVRIGLSLLMVLAYVIIEKSPLDSSVTAFLSPFFMMVVLVIGAIYFHGDFLIFMYSCGIAIISLSYLKPKSLAAYVAATGLMFVIIWFVFKINLLGAAFTAVYNILYLITSVALNFLIYIFCKSYVHALISLTEAKNEASLASKAKGSFLASMSHEIRTPLNAIIGLTEVELRRQLPLEDLDNLRKIHTSGNLLMGIINDILDMSKIESGKFELVPMEYIFADMIYDTAALNAVRIGSKRIRFLISIDKNIPCRMNGDELRIKQLLSNLLSNAFKFTHEGSVELRVTWRPESGGARVVFEVVDTGIGIRDDDLKDLFSEYTQVYQTSTRDIEGTGLGLSIAKGLCELMNGNISAKSEIGKGSVFTVDICQEIVDETPIGEQIANSLMNFTYQPKINKPKMEFVPMPYARVLVVDDIDLNLEVAAACLASYQISVDVTDNGADAVQKIKDGEPKYDLIFMDHMMPGMDGIEATRAIRKLGTQYAQSLPIVALTANALVGNDKMFADNGFQDFLSKPIEVEKLDEVLHKWVYNPTIYDPTQSGKLNLW